MRSFGVLKAYEAYDRGIDTNKDHEWQSWVSFDLPMQPSILEANVITNKETGVAERWREKSEKVQGMHGEIEYKATLVPKIRRKYKDRADDILAGLLKMHQEYKKEGEGVSFTGYSEFKCLWHKSANRKLNYEEKMELYFELGPARHNACTQT